MTAKRMNCLSLAIMFFIMALSFWCLCGCGTLGTADKETMMQRWRGEPVNENLLADINAYGNYAKKGNPLEPGKCVDQTDYKASILKELGVPYRVVRCEVTRDNPWRSKGHKFLIAQVNNGWFVLDNGAIQDGIFEFYEVKRSTSGVTNYQILP